MGKEGAKNGGKEKAAAAHVCRCTAWKTGCHKNEMRTEIRRGRRERVGMGQKRSKWEERTAPAVQNSEVQNEEKRAPKDIGVQTQIWMVKKCWRWEWSMSGAFFDGRCSCDRQCVEHTGTRK
jgi:hypothetical protein